MDLEWTAVQCNFTTVEGLPNPKPDYFETYKAIEYPLKGRKALGWSLLPCSSHPIAIPTLCVEFKAPGKGPNNAILQAAYDGAFMVYAAWETHKYMKKPAQDLFGITKALVITITDDHFNLFACHAMPADWNHHKEEYPRKLHYHIFKLVGSIIDSQGNLKTVWRSIRNAQDWCHAQAKSVKKDLWEYFERLEKEETRSTVEERKREKAEPEQGQQDQQNQPTKKRKRRSSSGASRL
jgi:hypothetical protein